MNPLSSTSHRRVEWLDSVRGLAALTVLFGHTVGILRAPIWFERLLNVPIVSTIVDGRTAVTMFFLLSGFVLALPYARPRGDGGFRKVELASFYLRRFTRIWLPWFAVFCLSALAMVTVFGDYKTNPNPTQWAMQFWQEPLTLGRMARQLIFSVHDPVKVLVPQDWSLGVELKASLLLPLLIWLLRKSPWALTGFAFALLLLYPTGYYYFTFAGGVMLARYSTEVGKWFENRSRITKVILFASAIALYNARTLGSRWQEWERTTWCAAAAGCLLILVAGLGSRRLAALLSRPLLVFVGRISYSVYLTHFLVLLCCVRPSVSWINSLGLNNPTTAYFFSILIAFGITIPLSMASYRWIELPSVELGRSLSTRLQENLRIWNWRTARYARADPGPRKQSDQNVSCATSKETSRELP